MIMPTTTLKPGDRVRPSKILQDCDSQCTHIPGGLAAAVVVAIDVEPFPDMTVKPLYGPIVSISWDEGSAIHQWHAANLELIP